MSKPSGERWPVDEAAVRRSTERVLARIAARRAYRRRGAALGVAASVVAALALGRVGGGGGPVAAVAPRAEVAEVRRVDGPADSPSWALASGDPRSEVVLVREGSLEVDGVVVPAGHWAVTVEGAPTVVFPDGQAPPAVPEWEGTRVREQLEEVRWRSLPPETLTTLDRLLEDR